MNWEAASDLKLTTSPNLYPSKHKRSSRAPIFQALAPNLWRNATRSTWSRTRAAQLMFILLFELGRCSNQARKIPSRKESATSKPHSNSQARQYQRRREGYKFWMTCKSTQKRGKGICTSREIVGLKQQYSKHDVHLNGLLVQESEHTAGGAPSR